MPRMTMATVVRNYLRWFELHQCKRTIAGSRAERRRRWLHSWATRLSKSPADYTLDADLMPNGAEVTASLDYAEPGRIEAPSAAPAKAAPARKP
jgi:hypothetical protein